MEKAEDFAERFCLIGTDSYGEMIVALKKRDIAICKDFAEKVVKWQQNLCRADDWKCTKCTECEQIRNLALEGENI